LLNNTNPKNGKKKAKSQADLFEKFAFQVTKASRSNYAFITALTSVVVWVSFGPAFHYSETWQMVINTFTTIITFLMVFLIQNAQNKDSLAIQSKLNELVAAHEFAGNRLVDVENMTEEELRVIQKYYNKLSNFTKKEESLQQSHSIDEAHENHDLKKEMDQELSGKTKTDVIK